MIGSVQYRTSAPSRRLLSKSAGRLSRCPSRSQQDPRAAELRKTVLAERRLRWKLRRCRLRPRDVTDARRAAKGVPDHCTCGRTPRSSPCSSAARRLRCGRNVVELEASASPGCHTRRTEGSARRHAADVRQIARFMDKPVGGAGLVNAVAVLGGVARTGRRPAHHEGAATLSKDNWVRGRAGFGDVTSAVAERQGSERNEGVPGQLGSRRRTFRRRHRIPPRTGRSCRTAGSRCGQAALHRAGLRRYRQLAETDVPERRERVCRTIDTRRRSSGRSQGRSLHDRDGALPSTGRWVGAVAILAMCRTRRRATGVDWLEQLADRSGAARARLGQSQTPVAADNPLGWRR